MRIVEKAEVFEKLTMEKMHRGHATVPLLSLKAENACSPPEPFTPLTALNMFGFMPAYLGKGDYFGAKVINACSANIGTKYPSHVGYVIILRPSTERWPEW